MDRSISIPEWHQMAMKGKAPPVRILLNGGSMNPLIRMNRDYVTIVPVQEEPVAGDIVLFSDRSQERYVVHRIWETGNGRVLTWGDSCEEPDGWFPLEAVWGKIVLIERGKRTIHPDPQKGLKWAKTWRRIMPVYKFCRRIKQGIARRIKKQRV